MKKLFSYKLISVLAGSLLFLGALYFFNYSNYYPWRLDLYNSNNKVIETFEFRTKKACDYQGRERVTNQSHYKDFKCVYIGLNLNPNNILKPVESDVVARFIVQTQGSGSHDRQVFVSYEVLGEEVQGNLRNLYVWALIEEYYIEEQKLTQGSGSNLPIKIVEESINNEWVPKSYKIPGDGNKYTKDVKEIFPQEAQDKIFASAAEHNVRVKRLEEENQQKAKNYFNGILNQ